MWRLRAWYGDAWATRPRTVIAVWVLGFFAVNSMIAAYPERRPIGGAFEHFLASLFVYGGAFAGVVAAVATYNRALAGMRRRWLAWPLAIVALYLSLFSIYSLGQTLPGVRERMDRIVHN